jgi:hypothetical protein
MPPKKRPGKDYPAEGSSQAVVGQVLETTTQPQAFTEPRPAMADTGRPGEPPEQPAVHAKVPPMNTSMPSTQPPLQHRETKTQEDQQQDSEEEIKAIIEDELAHLRQENEPLRLIQEQMARRKAMAKRSQTMQQQIEQERATQAELQRAIEHLHQQEYEPSVQEPSLQQH